MASADLTIVNLWRREYSPEISKHIPYEATQQLQQLSALFSPGLSYFYVLNMHNLQLDYISPSVEEVTGIPQKEATIERLVAASLPEEMPILEKKELVIKDFFYNYLKPEQLPFYKLLYTYRVNNGNGRKQQQMLHQASVLSVSDNQKVQHVLSIHTDISHLKATQTDTISFMSLDGNRSFMNMPVEQGIFNPNLADDRTPCLSRLLTSREMEIVKLLAKGSNAKEIAEKLNLSFNTVRTHRKNMLSKTDCTNTTELVAKCLMAGLL